MKKLPVLLLSVLSVISIASCSKGGSSTSVITSTTTSEPTSTSKTTEPITKLAITKQPTEYTEVVVPSGLSLEVEVNNENLVKSYQWEIDNGEEGEPFWVPLDCSTGRSKKLIKPSSQAGTNDHPYRCKIESTSGEMLISDVARVKYVNSREFVNCISFAGYAIKAGETFDLATTNLGSGKVTVSEEGNKVTLNNVLFDNSNPVYDYYDTSVGLDCIYYNAPFEKYTIQIEGVNNFTNTYWQKSSNSGGMPFTFNFMGSSRTVKYVEFVGDGQLSITGGTHLIYANTAVHIECDMNFGKIGNRYATGIFADEIVISDNVNIDANLNGFILQTASPDEEHPLEGVTGSITINNATISAVTSAPMVSIGSTDFHAISAMNKCTINGSVIHIDILLNEERFDTQHGVGNVVGVQSHYSNLEITNSELSISYTSSCITTRPFAINLTSYYAKGDINILSSTFYVRNVNPTLVNSCGFSASHINILDSYVNYKAKTKGNALGISSTYEAKFAGSEIIIDLASTGSAKQIFGVIAGGLDITGASSLDINAGNNGVGIAIQVGAGEEARTFEDSYVPTLLNNYVISSPIDYVINVMSLEGSLHNYVYMETIYSDADHTVPASSVKLSKAS